MNELLQGKKVGLLLIAALFLWMLAQMVQAAGLTLDPDEAYYWMYSRYLDWGYFDHPPAIAVLIRFSSSILDGSLGVRLGAILLQGLSLVLLWDMLGRPKERAQVLTLLALIIGQPWLHVYGFVSTPDSPLLFSTVFFLWAYRKFVDLPDLPLALLLGVAMAALLYSKYHGLLVIGFVSLSNFRLFRQPLFFLAGAVGLLLYVPHLHWQWAHDFPSFRYHLVDRNNQFLWKYPLTYLVNQLVLFNPLMIGFLVAALWLQRQAGLLYRACFGLVVGFWVFFLASTLRGHAEPQWTAVVAIGLIIPAYRHSLYHPLFAKWIRRMGLISLLLFVAVRFLLLFPPESLRTPFQPMDWTRALAHEAQGRNLYFQNSYQDASLYAFYTGNPAFTYADLYYRKNQFDIWQLEEQAQGEPALIAGNESLACDTCKARPMGRRKYLLVDLDTLIVAQHLTMAFDTAGLVWAAGTELSLPVRLHNPYSVPVMLSNPEMPIRPFACFVRDEYERYALPAKAEFYPDTLQAGESIRTRMTFDLPPDKTGDLAFAMGLQWGVFQPGIHSKPVKVTIQPASKTK